MSLFSVLHGCPSRWYDLGTTPDKFTAEHFTEHIIDLTLSQSNDVAMFDPPTGYDMYVHLQYVAN